MGYAEALKAAEHPWYVIHTRGGNERQLKEQLAGLLEPGDETLFFVPEKLEGRKFQGHYRKVRRVFFSGYVFVSTPDAKDLYLKMREKQRSLNLLRSELHGIPWPEDGSVPFLEVGPEDKKLLLSLLRWRGPSDDETEEAGDPSDPVADVSVGTIGEDGKLRVFDGPLKGLEPFIIKLDRHAMKALLRITLFGEEKQYELGVAVVERGGSTKL